ncbi:MAG TPA: NUDIX hydrolase [Dehalococcoidia bacterium]|nr:NUDIX hydrolase [Dehalococcoidia bacterium]
MGTDVASTIVTISLLLVREGRALVVRRHGGHSESPGAWDLPGGRLLDWEDDIDAAVLRIAQEELGVRSTGYEFFATQYAPLVGGEPRVDNLYIVDTWEGDPRINSIDQHDAMKWAQLEELAHLPLVEPRRTLVQRLFGGTGDSLGESGWF